jgi:hypothetical protein
VRVLVKYTKRGDVPDVGVAKKVAIGGTPIIFAETETVSALTAGDNIKHTRIMIKHKFVGGTFGTIFFMRFVVCIILSSIN